MLHLRHPSIAHCHVRHLSIERSFCTARLDWKVMYEKIARSLGLIETFRWVKIPINEDGMHGWDVKDHHINDMINWFMLYRCEKRMIICRIQWGRGKKMILIRHRSTCVLHQIKKKGSRMKASAYCQRRTRERVLPSRSISHIECIVIMAWTQHIDVKWTLSEGSLLHLMGV